MNRVSIASKWDDMVAILFWSWVGWMIYYASPSNKFRFYSSQKKKTKSDLPDHHCPCLPLTVALPRFSAYSRGLLCSGDYRLASREVHRFSGLKKNGIVIIVFCVPYGKKLTSIASSKSFWSISPLWLTSESEMRTKLYDYSNAKEKTGNTDWI